MMDNKKDAAIRNYRLINVVAPELAAKLQDYRLRLSAINSGYPVLTDWHPVIPDGWGEFPQVPIRRTLVYRAKAQSWAYSHHQTITKFGGKYVASWSAGLLHEDYVGQEVHYAVSDDGVNWSDPGVVVATPVESGLVRQNAGLYTTDDHLYCYVGVARDYGLDVLPPEQNDALQEQYIGLTVYETADLKTWTRIENAGIEKIKLHLYEEPRLTAGGRLLCGGFDLKSLEAKAVIWDDSSRPTARPRLVDIPPSSEGLLPVQGTWYQNNDGQIWMFQRDSSVSCRLALTFSDDEGETWSELLKTDFPNTYSRLYVGRLSDGRYFIVGNNYDIFLDRRHLLIALSDEGRVFDRQYTLVEEPTTRRINGRHKEDGYQYPNCCVDGDKLLVIYSVNKEDVEVSMVDMSKVD